MKLPTFKTDDLSFQLMQDRWSTTLNPIISNQILSGNYLAVDLEIGANTFNHLLAKKQRGWIITDQDAAAQIYRSQPFNDQTLTLTSNAAVTVNLLVY